MTTTDLQAHVDMLTESYLHELKILARKATEATEKAPAYISTHDSFNMANSCSKLAELAGKIELAKDMIRWMAK